MEEGLGVLCEAVERLHICKAMLQEIVVVE